MAEWPRKEKWKGPFLAVRNMCYYGIKNYYIKAMGNFTSLNPVKVFGQGFDFFIYLAMYLGKWIQYTT